MGRWLPSVGAQLQVGLPIMLPCQLAANCAANWHSASLGPFGLRVHRAMVCSDT